jgi:UDP-N-acetyl-D-mannosaminuronic acid transferase (WecB/TagA/CpsF family)
MKTQLKDVVFSNTFSNTEVPNWVSEMGLEWLYRLLSKTDTWSGAARQS